uniref:Uncharacterized protein n=1 Tax=Meloidogyne floridensis TaxID=298350 RepID=A0A915P7W4_9BILA
LQNYRELYSKNEKGEWDISKSNTGPTFCIGCDRNKTMIINGIYFRREDCVEDDNPKTKCAYVTCFYCKTVEGSNDANWYWQNPEGEWIYVSLMDCYPTEGLNKGETENKID